MLRWNSRAAMTAFLLTILSTDAVFGGIIQVQRAGLPKSDDKLLGAPKMSDTAVVGKDRNSRELKGESSLLSIDSQSVDTDIRQHNPPPADFDLFENDNNLDDPELRAKAQRQQESANAASGAIAYIAGAFASVLFKPVVNNLPSNFNKAIVGFASVINSISNNGTEDGNTTLVPAPYDAPVYTRQAREVPVYGFDGAISNAVSWINGEEINKADSIAPTAEELAQLSSLQGPDAARISMEPLLKIFGAIRRAIFTEFLATAAVMMVAHVTRLFLVNIPAMLPIFGLTRTNAANRREQIPADTEKTLHLHGTQTGAVENSFAQAIRDRVKQAEVFARQIVAAVTREQCAERATCLIGAHFSQYSVTSNIMRLLRSPEPNREKPDHPVWVAFRNAAEGKITADACDQLYRC